MTTLATLVKDAQYLKNLKSSDQSAFKINNYIIDSADLNRDIKCQSNVCEYSSQEITQDVKWIFCFSCDQNYHMDCICETDVDEESIPTPYICNNCSGDPRNSVAKSLASNLDKVPSVIERKKQRMDIIKIQSSSREQKKMLAEIQRQHLASEQRNVEYLKELQSLKMQMQTITSELSKVSMQEKPKIANAFNSTHLPGESILHTTMFLDSSHIPPCGMNVKQPIRDDHASNLMLNSVMSSSRPAIQPETLSDSHTQATLNKAKFKLPEISMLSTEEEKGLSMEARLTREQMMLSHAAATAQVELNHRATLESCRKALPKITKFDGNPKTWLRFKADVEREKIVGEYEDTLIKFHIRAALEGRALNRVETIIDMCSLPDLMAILENSFGNPDVIISCARDEVAQIAIKGDLTRDQAVEINTIIQSYKFACQIAGLDIIDSHHLAKRIIDQFSSFHKQGYRAYCRENHPTLARIEDLKFLYGFLESLMRDLEPAPFVDVKKVTKPAQILATAVNTTASFTRDLNRSNDNFKYEIRSNDAAPYLGYNMEQVQLIAKLCECCGQSNHFLIECRSFRALDEEQRKDLINSKKICRNCLLSSAHEAAQCSVKLGCGAKVGDGLRCAQKHHIILHFYKNNSKFNRKRRSNTNYNSERSQHLVTKHANSLAHKPEATSEDQRNTVTQCGYVVLENGSIAKEFQLTDTAASAAKSNVYTVGVQNVSPEYEVKVKHRPFIHNNKSQQSNVSQCNMIQQQPQKTVKVFRTIIYGANQLYTHGFAIGDSGAEITLVRSDLIRELGIRGQECAINLQWADEQIKQSRAQRVILRIKGVLPDSPLITLDECYAVDDLNLASRSLNVNKLKTIFPYLKEINFDSYENVSPSLLIGSRHAHIFEAVEGIKEGGPGNPVGMKCKLGYTIYGGAPEQYDGNNFASNVQVLSESSAQCDVAVSNEQLEKIYTKFCSVESLGISHVASHATKDEKNAIAILEEEMRILPNGSVEVPLIWNRNNKEIPSLPNNMKMVYKRQLSHEQKLSKSPELKKAFNDNFNELLQKGYARVATTADIENSWPNVWYLPMSLVVNRNKDPVAYRNVYDAPARYLDTSLNEKLLMGPNLLIDMLKPLMELRMNAIAFTADVKSMFLQIYICARDQQCQRILWREDDSKPMKIYVLERMLFGPKCSPFTSQYVKNKRAEQFVDKFPEAARTIIENTYMDDVLSSETSVDKAVSIALQCIEIFKSMNWDLVGFQSNSTEFLRKIPEEHIKKDLIPLLSNDKDSYTTKVLGAAWDTVSDCFVYQLNKNNFVKLAHEFDFKPTKRDQCSTIARIFDVLGFIAHVLIRGKILLQRSWKLKLDWDDVISDEENKLWKNWIQDLNKITELKIPRQHLPAKGLSCAQRVEFHAFCDAGKEAVAAAVYIVSSFRGCKYVSLALAKAKVAPVKIKTKSEITEMPRLELIACLIASRLLNTVEKLHSSIKAERFIWTDSEIALCWIKNENIRLPRFAISPVEEILENSERKEWRYVPSKQNPADVATKFVKFDFGDSNSIWFQGPDFVKQPVNSWPVQKSTYDQAAVTAQINLHQFSFSTGIVLPAPDCVFAGDWIIDKLSNSIKSNWRKLVRAVARALKFLYDAIIPAVKSKQFEQMKMRNEIKVKNNNFSQLTAIDLERAELFIIRKMQREVYQDDFKKLAEGRMPKNRQLQQLHAFIDDQGVLRIDSRVVLPVKVFPQRFSPAVPREASFTDALLFYYHRMYNHVCLEAQVACFRSKYWMEEIRAALKATKGECCECKLKSVTPSAPLMAPLPEYRIDTRLKPFEVTGVDCTGSFTIYTANGRPKKVWLLLFTCTLTRYIHSHTLESMGTTALLEAIATFWTAYGPTTQFISDNGTNFVGAAKVIARALEDSKAELNETLAEKYGLQWQHIPVSSPWFGAFYERMIKELKRAFAGTLDGKKINKTEFNIAVQDACHRVNCRPLTHNPISHEDEEVLTPHHLVKGRSGWPLLPSIHRTKTLPGQISDRSLYSRGRKLADEVMRRFTSYYLPVLTKRTKWTKEAKPLAVGELVMLINPNETREQWKRGKVIKLYKGRDGRCRVADILVADGVVRKNRSVQRLARLNIQKLSSEQV